jgi:hypothetical protein
MFNDWSARIFARAIIETRCAPEDEPAAFEALEGMSPAQVAALAHRYLGTWQENTHEIYCLSTVAAQHGDSEAAQNLATLAAAHDRAAGVLRAFLTGSLLDRPH